MTGDRTDIFRTGLIAFSGFFRTGHVRELCKHMYTPSCKMKTIEGNKQIYTRRSAMKGYLNEDGYMGFVNGRYILFASEAEYEEYMTED